MDIFFAARPLVHLCGHFAVPAIVARVWYSRRWYCAWAILSATMLVDLDHLFASPIYDPGRCSIGFHPLHQWPAIAGYVVATVYKPLRLVAIGLLIHMALDGVDCVFIHAG